MIEISTTASGETIRSMTPSEYVKAHAAEESKRRHILDLHQFVAFMTGELQSGQLSELTPEGTDRLIDAYLSRSRG